MEFCKHMCMLKNQVKHSTVSTLFSPNQAICFAWSLFFNIYLLNNFYEKED